MREPVVAARRYGSRRTKRPSRDERAPLRDFRNNATGAESERIGSRIARCSSIIFPLITSITGRLGCGGGRPISPIARGEANRGGLVMIENNRNHINVQSSSVMATPAVLNGGRERAEPHRRGSIVVTTTDRRRFSSGVITGFDRAPGSSRSKTSITIMTLITVRL